MKVRQLVQILVFPKSFNVLSFYSKGNYTIRVKLTLQNKRDSTCIRAFPILIQGNEARKEDDKKANINTLDCYYQTERFFVTFSQEKIVFNTACLFKVEYTVGEEYLTYFDFEIVYCNAKRKIAPESAQPIKVDKIVDKRRIYVNSYNSVNKFKRVLFDDSDYFSYSDVLFIAQSFGEKIRLQNYQFTEFYNSDLRAREKFSHEAFGKWIEIGFKERAQLLKEHFNLSPELFYAKMISQKIIRYRKLCQTYQKYRFLMETMNNSNLSTSLQLDHLQWIKANQLKRVQQLMDIYQTDNIPEIFMLIFQQSHQILRNTKFIWQQLISLLISINFNLLQQLSSRQIEEQRKTKTKWLLTYSDIIHKQVEEKRNQFISKRNEIIQKMDMYQDNDIHHPFLIIENFQAECTPTRQGLQIDSLMVMVHGYQGSSIDLEKARNFMNIYNPYCHGLLIKTIQDDIDNPIQSLGEAVAQEIRLHILNSLNCYKRINFMGYSLGGIIARQSVKHLQRFKDMMNIFISFASPHAGICDASNPLVKTGIWFLTNFQKNKNLKQLNCEPNPDSEYITLIKLSDCDSIRWFKRFVAVSSKEDCFVPYESSRLQQQNLGDMTRSICLNLKKKIKRLERVDVWFDANHIAGTFDKIIGRRSHIQFLQNRMFLDSFFATYGPLL